MRATPIQHVADHVARVIARAQPEPRRRRLSGRERLQRLRWRAKDRRWKRQARRAAERLGLCGGEMSCSSWSRYRWADYCFDALPDVPLLRYRPHLPQEDMGCLYCGGHGDCTHCVRGSEFPF